MTTHTQRRDTGPIRRFVRRNLAHVVGWFVVIFAVGALGMAQALPGSNTVTSDDIVNGQVKRADIARNAVTSAKIKNGSVKRADLRADAVNSVKVLDESLVGADVLDGSLTGADIADGSIGNADLGNNQVNSQKITDNSVISADIANGQVLNADLGNNQVNSVKITDNSVTSGDILNNSLTGADIANNSSLGAAEINEAALQFGCSQAGIANAWAYVDGNNPSLGTSFTTSYIPARFNCSDSSSTAVQARRVSTGVFEVRFRNLTGWIMTGTIDYNGNGSCARSNLSVDYRGASSGFGVWRVEIYEPTGLGTTPRNCEFSLVYF